MKRISISSSAASLWLLVSFALLAGSCTKLKQENTIPLLNVANSSASSIRLFNFSGNYADITVNNIPLTSYTAVGNNTAGGTQIGLSLFPTGQWLSGDDASPFTLPNSLLDKDGKAHFVINATGNATTTIDTTIVNNVAHPQDYYLMPSGYIKVLDRDNLPSANPQNIKIRILHLGSHLFQDQYNGLGLNGPVSLTYADGSPVDPALNNVAEGSASGYIELPYGSYQFKLYLSNGAIDITKQLSEIPNMPPINPCSPAVPPLQEGLSPRVRTFKPGGVYSIVVTENLQKFLDCSSQNANTYINTYRIITELDPGVNSTYARMQAVNALPGQQVTITVDGKPLGGLLPYIGSAPSSVAQQAVYQIYVQGNHHVQATDGNGTVLAEGDIRLYPFDNYTIWAYVTPDGKPAILFEANDMSGTLYEGGTAAGVPDDGTNGGSRRQQINYALESRFLNLSPDLPYVTFTNDQSLFLPAVGQSYADTLRYFSAYVNLASGIMPARNPFLIYNLQPGAMGGGTTYSEFTILPKLIRVYQSSSGDLPEVPGILLTQVAPVTVSQAFIANPDLYSPSHQIAETGVYTVALVGKTFTASQDSEKARIIVIKHNK